MRTGYLRNHAKAAGTHQKAPWCRQALLLFWLCSAGMPTTQRGYHALSHMTAAPCFKLQLSYL
jgi:hypothetical protein